MAIPLLIAAGVIAAGTAIAGAVSSANAAAAEKESAEKAIDFQREMFNKQQANQQPWLDAGRTTLADLMAQMKSGAFNVDAESLANDPGYQFRMAEGQKALERSAAARGGLNSGGFMKSLTRYGQGVASDEFMRAQARSNDRFNRLASIAGVGQLAAQNIGAMGGQTAANVGSLYGAIGNANAAAAMGQGNAIASGFQAGGNLLGMGYAYGGGGAQIPQQAPTGPGPWAQGYQYPR